jgi:hypothetical protein
MSAQAPTTDPTQAVASLYAQLDEESRQALVALSLALSGEAGNPTTARDPFAVIGLALRHTAVCWDAYGHKRGRRFGHHNLPGDPAGKE